MDVMGAINKRFSCRAYGDRWVEHNKLDLLAAAVEGANMECGDARLVLVRPKDGGRDLRLTPAMFSGQPTTYIALIAPEDAEVLDHMAYCAEKVVLLATDLGLSTCWVCGTYDKKTVHVPLEEGEELHGVIVIGYPPSNMPLKQRTIRAALRRRDKRPQAIYAGYDTAPNWLCDAVDAVRKGPSAVNGQPVEFVDSESGIVATLTKVKSGIEYLDLGIAKLHFELAAAEHGVHGSWEWGPGAVFRGESS